MNSNIVKGGSVPVLLNVLKILSQNNGNNGQNNEMIGKIKNILLVLGIK
jgi:hypothetical protein